MAVQIHTNMGMLIPIGRLIHIPMVISTDIGRYIYPAIGRAS